jgi:hypothetical protein
MLAGEDRARLALPAPFRRGRFLSYQPGAVPVMIDRGTATDHSKMPADGATHENSDDAPRTAEASGEPVEDESRLAEASADPDSVLLDPSRAGEPSLSALEARVRRLEEELARLQDTQQMETRIVSRVLEQVKNECPGPVRESTAIMAQAGRHLLPAAVGALQAHAATVEAPAQPSLQPTRQPWLIVELYADLRTLLRMARDPLYRTVWLGRALLPLALVAAIFTSGLWLNLVPGFAFLPAFMAGLLTKVVDLFLAFILCKALQREIRRYREAVSDPAPARHS